MALIKINNQSLTNVTELPAAISTGGFSFIKKVAINTSSAVQEVTGIFSADYSQYKLIWYIIGSDSSDDDISHGFQFLKASDGSVDTEADINYASHGIDSQASARTVTLENKNYFNVLYNTSENNTPSYYEMNVYSPFAAGFTSISGHAVYMINADVDVTTANFGAMRDNTTSYSGMRLVISSSSGTGGTPDVSASATGYVLVYGMAEA